VIPYTLRDQPQWVQASLEQIDRVVELNFQRKSAMLFRDRYLWLISRKSYLVLVRAGGAIRRSDIFESEKKCRHSRPVAGTCRDKLIKMSDKQSCDSNLRV